MFTIALAEDHAVTRNGLRSLLENRLAGQVIATTGDGLRVFSLLNIHRPDVLVLNLDLPSLSGLDVLRKIDEKDFSVEVVVLTAREKAAFVETARQLGAAGYVLKREPVEEVQKAVRAAGQGRRYFSEATREIEKASSLNDAPLCEELTSREREVLQLTAEAYTASEIGNRLGICTGTVRKHQERLREKLGASNAVELAACVYRRGLLPWQTGPEPTLETR